MKDEEQQRRQLAGRARSEMDESMPEAEATMVVKWKSGGDEGVDDGSRGGTSVATEEDEQRPTMWSRKRRAFWRREARRVVNGREGKVFYFWNYGFSIRLGKRRSQNGRV
ncbi:unnamed protein product [Linum trigynum]|uniref:Uncharacterized protein n=1 Tax=Linum trigynum TaxID=586398 RepID=A0AAV2FPG8_9ROSI